MPPGRGGKSLVTSRTRLTCGVRHTDVPTALHDVLADDAAIVLVRWDQWVAR